MLYKISWIEEMQLKERIYGSFPEAYEWKEELARREIYHAAIYDFATDRILITEVKKAT
jgi:hypothetical protein